MSFGPSDTHKQAAKHVKKTVAASIYSLVMTLHARAKNLSLVNEAYNQECLRAFQPEMHLHAGSSSFLMSGYIRAIMHTSFAIS